MLKKRIIPCLDIKDGRTVKGINFKQIRDAGDPIELAKRYLDEGADELTFLDITATIEQRKTLSKLVEKIAREINIPFTVGGGISSVEDAALIINSGADKITINSAAVKQTDLITNISQQFGSQCVVVAIDTKFNDIFDEVYISGGKIATGKNTMEWAKEVEKLGAGEILLTSMNGDGTKNGFDLAITEKIANAVNIPVIASGGAGSMHDFVDLFTQTKASAGLAASIFHFNEIPIQNLKQYLSSQNIPVRCR